MNRNEGPAHPESADFALQIERRNGEWIIWSQTRDRSGGRFLIAVLEMIAADLAQGIEAGTAETRSGSVPLDESPVPKGCAQGDIAKEARDHPCTCHPDDNPPKPCPKRYAYSDCVSYAAGVAEGMAKAAEIAREHQKHKISGVIFEPAPVDRIAQHFFRAGAQRVAEAILAASPGETT